MSESLKSQDVVIAIKLVAFGNNAWTQSSLAKSLNMSPAFINHALPRLDECGFYKSKKKLVLVDDLQTFLIFGIRHVFPTKRGERVRGTPTSIGAEPMRSHMAVEALNWPPVWPYLLGSEQGYAIQPLCPAIEKVLEDKLFYEILSLVDVLREGRPREKQIAIDELKKRFNQYKVEVS
jgi:hypothetical protein